jgi:hypothetical protein
VTIQHRLTQPERKAGFNQPIKPAPSLFVSTKKEIEQAH